MISIINRTGNLEGICIYEVRINDQHIVAFRHKREEGLSKCLLLASEAVSKQQELNPNVVVY